jgi:hypothetical protein
MIVGETSPVEANLAVVKKISANRQAVLFALKKS